MSKSKAIIAKVIFSVPFILYFVLLSIGINNPYVGQNAYNFIIYSLIAHNYNQFGYLSTKLSSIVSVSEKLPLDPEYFLHHPPLLSVIISIFIKIFGEDFWVARVPIILFAFGTLVIFYLVIKLVANKKTAFYSSLVFVLVPAASIFGKLIGQEALVLFFCLTSLYFSVKYLLERKRINLYLGIVSIVLATLSDWPAVFFSIFLVLLYAKHKKTKKGLLIFIASILTAGILALWIAWIRNGLWDVNNAIVLRSFLGLSQVSVFWPFLWVGATFIRLVVYFNPIFVFLSGVTLVGLFRLRTKKKLDDAAVVLFIFFLFGFAYLLTYSQAYFTHPYLIYYLTPFIALGAGIQLRNLAKKRKIIFSLIILLSIFILVFISFQKNIQVISNMWRYEMASYARKSLMPYEKVVYNKHYAIDPDIWRYPLLISPVQSDENDSKKFLSNYKHYVYSCEGSCYSFRGWIEPLKKRYKFERVISTKAEMYVFYLQEKQAGKNKKTYLQINKVDENIITNWYRKIRDILMVPQV